MTSPLFSVDKKGKKLFKGDFPDKKREILTKQSHNSQRIIIDPFTNETFSIIPAAPRNHCIDVYPLTGMTGNELKKISSIEFLQPNVVKDLKYISSTHLFVVTQYYVHIFEIKTCKCEFSFQLIGNQQCCNHFAIGDDDDIDQKELFQLSVNSELTSCDIYIEPTSSQPIFFGIGTTTGCVIFGSFSALKSRQESAKSPFFFKLIKYHEEFVSKVSFKLHHEDLLLKGLSDSDVEMEDSSSNDRVSKFMKLSEGERDKQIKKTTLMLLSAGEDGRIHIFSVFSPNNPNFNEKEITSNFGNDETSFVGTFESEATVKTFGFCGNSEAIQQEQLFVITHDHSLMLCHLNDGCPVRIGEPYKLSSFNVQDDYILDAFWLLGSSTLLIITGTEVSEDNGPFSSADDKQFMKVHAWTFEFSEALKVFEKDGEEVKVPMPRVSLMFDIKVPNKLANNTIEHIWINTINKIHSIILCEEGGVIRVIKEEDSSNSDPFSSNNASASITSSSSSSSGNKKGSSGPKKRGFSPY